MADEHKNEPFIKQWISKHNLRYQYHHLKEWDASLISMAMNGESLREQIQTVLIQKAHFDSTDAILLATDLIAQFQQQSQVPQQQSTDCGKYSIYLVSIVGLLFAIWNAIWEKGLKFEFEFSIKNVGFFIHLVSYAMIPYISSVVLPADRNLVISIVWIGILYGSWN